MDYVNWGTTLGQILQWAFVKCDRDTTRFRRDGPALVKARFELLKSGVLPQPDLPANETSENPEEWWTV